MALELRVEDDYFFHTQLGKEGDSKKFQESHFRIKSTRQPHPIKHKLNMISLDHTRTDRISMCFQEGLLQLDTEAHSLSGLSNTSND